MRNLIYFVFISIYSYVGFGQDIYVVVNNKSELKSILNQENPPSKIKINFTDLSLLYSDIIRITG